MNDLLIGHLNGIIIFLVFLFFISLSNIFLIFNPARCCHLEEAPLVSVLIPARNEEDSIASCICSLLGQDYPFYEVIVLDDNSEDKTTEILDSFRNPKLKWIKGKPLPHGWAGKSWACHQLSGFAKGDYLLFTDADTIHNKSSISCTISTVQRTGAGFASLMPLQVVVTFMEKLIVPVINWAIFFFLPLFLAYRLPYPFLSAAVGQYILFSRVAYDKCGGHAAVKESVDDDLALAKQAKRMGVKWILMNGKDLLSCRMYSNARQVWDGFGKNLFSITGYRILPHLFIWLWTALIFIAPLAIILAYYLTTVAMPTELVFRVAAAFILATLLWLIMLCKFGLPLYLVFIYPLAVFMTVSAALYSMVLFLFGRSTWKGRAVRVRARLF